MDVNVAYGSVMQSSSKFADLRSLSSAIVLIRALWFHTNTRSIRSQITFSTGAIIGRRCVLTAAHNIYQAALQAFCDEVELIFNFNAGRQITKDHFRISFSLDFSNFKCSLTREQKDGKKVYEHDFALILIPTNNPKLQGLLANSTDSLHILSGLQLDDRGGIEAYIQGFPDLTQDEVRQFKKKRQLVSGNKGGFVQALMRQDLVRVTRVQGNGIYYSCRTKSGQSGSPIMVAMAMDDRVNWFIIGVHNSFSKTKNIGKGVFFNNTITHLLKQWYIQLTTHKLYLQEYHQLQAIERSSFISSLPEQLPPVQDTDESQEELGKYKEELDQYLKLELQTLPEELIKQYRTSYRHIDFGLFIDSVRHCINDFKEGLLDNLSFKLRLESDYAMEPAGSYEINNELHAARDHSKGQSIVLVNKFNLPEDQKGEENIGLEELNIFYDELLRNHLPIIATDRTGLDHHPIHRNDRQLVTHQQQSTQLQFSSSVHQDQLITLPLIEKEGLNQDDMNISIFMSPMFDFSKMFPKSLLAFMQDHESLCYQCLFLTNEWFICLDEECALRTVELCPCCIGRHKGHPVIPAQREALLSHFRNFNSTFYWGEEGVGRIQGQVAVITNLLNMNLLKKLMESQASRLERPLQLLRAMLFKKDQQIYESVNAILAHEGQQLYRASLIHKLMHSLNQQQLSRFLEIQTDRTRQAVTSIYEYLQSSMQKLCTKMEQLKALDYEDVLIELKKKYESIINIKSEDNFVVQPQNIYDIDIRYYELIREVVIIKDFEEYQQPQHLIEKRKGRVKFWRESYSTMNKIKKMIQKRELTIDHLKLLIQQYVLELQDINSFAIDMEDQEDSILSRNIQDLLDIILMRKYAAFRQDEQYEWQSPPLKIFTVLLHPKMANLLRIEVRYDHARCCDFNSFFKLQAKDIFRIIDQNPNLQKFAIEGVRVYHFGRFLVKLWQIRCDISEEIKDFHSAFSSEDLQMMRRLNPKSFLQLDLGILLKIRNKAVIWSLDYFLKLFPCVSNLKVAISYSESIDTAKEDGLLEVLRRSLEQISRLKIWIMGQYLPANTLLLDAIKGLTNIVSVYISDFEVSVGQTDSNNAEKGLISASPSERAQISSLQLSLRKDLCEVSRIFVQTLAEIINHSDLEKFSIKRCPLVMGMQLGLPHLKEIIMVFRKPRTVNWHSLKNPYIVQLVYFQNVKLQPKHQHQSLQDFFTKLESIRYLQIIESNIEDRHLLSIPLSSYQRIKILNISRCIKISDDFAKVVFPSLGQITVLDISMTTIAPETVLAISSVVMEKLIISGLGLIYDYLLRQIDKKWPMLTSLNIYDCKGVVTSSSINGGSFRNLSELQISQGVLEEPIRLQLLMRGVEILPFY